MVDQLTGQFKLANLLHFGRDALYGIRAHDSRLDQQVENEPAVRN